MTKGPNGALLWEGASEYDGQPIALVATGIKRPSRNDKTGPMIQTWIVPADERPDHAVTNGADASVCGSCPERPINGGRCYVETGKAPLAVHGAYSRGSYLDASEPEARSALGLGHKIRLGAWGDPAAVPIGALADLIRDCDGWTGYSHATDDLDSPVFGACMVSASSIHVAREAWAKGLRTFRVLGPDDSIEANELMCPNTTHGVTCYDCGLCDGTRTVDGPFPKRQAVDRRKSIAIRAHGFNVSTQPAKSRLPIVAA